MTTSLIPFSKGQEVVERIGIDPDVRTALVKIVWNDNQKCKTATGHWYCRDTGMRLCKGDEYASITSPDYCKGPSEVPQAKRRTQ